MHRIPIEEWIIKLRREFHREPEISFKEYKTQERIIRILQDLGIEPQKIADTGVVATIHGQPGGPCIALRSDIDALEVLEVPTERNKEYISRNIGFMHACGHDGHIAMVLGAARLLQENRHTFAGNVRLIFQPAEEQPPGGAPRVIAEGGLDSVDAIVGMHIFGAVDVGKIAFREGSFMASSNLFSIKIIGKGGHHSNPEDCIDPILIAADFISTINKEVKNRIDPSRYVLGIGKIEGGAQFNRTPDEVNIIGSYRTFDTNDTKNIDEMITQTLDRLMGSYTTNDCNGTPAYDLEIMHGYPVLVNNAAFTKTVHSLLNERYQDVDGNAKPIFGAEDFAFYLQKVPGVYLTLGTKNPDKDIVEGNHSSRFDIDEDILITGTEILKSIALDFLEKPDNYGVFVQ
ncbi:MAG: M20 family metallopeptidase [Methanosarcinaceae archaeon]|nr:M20 family metallopeptidase [Methanosarcinaceae archaeon]